MFPAAGLRPNSEPVAVSVSGGVMTVTGGSQADIITVRENAGNADFYDGKTGATFSASGITAINISGGGKNDQIFYTGNTVGANVHGDGGDDSLSVNDTGTGSTTVSGDAGNDNITVLHGNNTQV